MKETVFVVLLALVSCQNYPDHGERAYPSPGLQLLTGGVSEFIVDAGCTDEIYHHCLPAKQVFKILRTADLEGKAALAVKYLILFQH